MVVLWLDDKYLGGECDEGDENDGFFYFMDWCRLVFSGYERWVGRRMNYMCD